MFNGCTVPPTVLNKEECAADGNKLGSDASPHCRARPHVQSTVVNGHWSYLDAYNTFTPCVGSLRVLDLASYPFFQGVEITAETTRNNFHVGGFVDLQR